MDLKGRVGDPLKTILFWEGWGEEGGIPREIIQCLLAQSTGSGGGALSDLGNAEIK